MYETGLEIGRIRLFGPVAQSGSDVVSVLWTNPAH